MPHHFDFGRTQLEQDVHDWILECFGETIAYDPEERNHRFIEEAIELVQSLDYSREQLHQMVDYVYNRSAGEPKQEVGGVLITLISLCLSQEISPFDCADQERERIVNELDVIRQRQRDKPPHLRSPYHDTI